MGTKASDYILKTIVENERDEGSLVLTLQNLQNESKHVTVTISRSKVKPLNVQISEAGRYQALFIGTVAIHNADITITDAKKVQNIEDTKVKLAITEPSETPGSKNLNNVLFTMIRQYVSSSDAELERDQTAHADYVPVQEARAQEARAQEARALEEEARAREARAQTPAPEPELDLPPVE